jgi:zinc transport system ATP-binding protein
MSNEPVIKIENVNFSYADMPVLEDVSLAIAERDFIWIVGPNGGGKTTLLKLIIGLLRPDTGTVSVFGRTPAKARSRIGYMPQQVNIDMHFPISAMDVVLMGRLGNGGLVGRYSTIDKEAARVALSDVGLYEYRDRHFSTLSGGEQRRLFIARALACDPDVLILDEPLANLDMVVEEEVHELLCRMNEQLTVILVSHDPALVSQFVKNVVCVNKKVAIHPTCEVDGEMMGELYQGKIRMVRHDRTSHGGNRCD